jgi:hypothetical protein
MNILRLSKAKLPVIFNTYSSLWSERKMSHQHCRQKWGGIPSILVSVLMLSSCTFEHSSTATNQASPAIKTPPKASTALSSVPSALSSFLGESGIVKKTQNQNCPVNKPIKGKMGWTGDTYYVPDSEKYSKVTPHECFATVDEALSAGYQAPKAKKHRELSIPTVLN